MAATACAKPCRIAAAAGPGRRASALRPTPAAALRPAAFRRPAPCRQLAVSASAMIAEWTDAEFTEEVLAAFPDKAIATVEEARCLIERGGYKYLDVRPTAEVDAVGKFKGSVNVPIVNARFVYDAEQGKKVLLKEDNLDFVAQVEKRFPDKDAALVIGCSDGRAYSIDALELLDEAGYWNMVGLKGGFNAWFRVFDAKGGRRRSGEYAEQYSHDGDSCGIHSSGAGFERVDAIERYVPPTF